MTTHHSQGQAVPVFTAGAWQVRLITLDGLPQWVATQHGHVMARGTGPEVASRLPALVSTALLPKVLAWLADHPGR